MITMTIKEGYLGQCAKCLKKDATQEKWVEFLTPIPADPRLDLPEVKGCFTYVCDECK